MSEIDDIKKALEQSTAKAASEVGVVPRESVAQKYVLTPLGNILDVLDTDLNAVTNTLRPIVTSINPKLNEVYDSAPKKFGMPNVVMSDLIDKSLEGEPGSKALSKILGFAADVAFSPTTYLAGVGTLTKGGKLLRKVKSLNDAGEIIATESRMGQEIAKHYGAQFATPELIRKAVKESQLIAVPSLEQQARMGQRALINIGIPFTKTEQPFIKAQLLYRGLDKAKEFLDSNKYMQSFHTLFSTSTGNPAFDSIRTSLVGLGRLRKENVKEFAAIWGKKAEAAATEYGMNRNDFLKMITDVGENAYRGDISAKALLNIFTTRINKQVVDGMDIERIIRGIPGVESITMDERGKLFRSLLFNAKQKAAGHDVFTTNFLQLPSDVRDVFVKEWTDGIGIKIAREVKQNKISQYVNFPQFFEAYNKGIKFKGLKFEPGVEAGLFALVGKDEYLRLAKGEQEYAKLAKALAIPSGVGTEIGAMRDTVQRLVAHIDQGFSTSYTLYKTNPEFLKSISPRMYKLQNLIDSKPEWKIQGLVDQFRLPLALAKKYPKAFDLAQEVRTFMQKQLQLEKDAGVPVSEFTGNLTYIPHIPTKEVRKYLSEKFSESFGGAAREWNRDHQNTIQRMLRVVNNRKVEEFYNSGLITKSQRKAILNTGESYIEGVIAKSKSAAASRTNELYRYFTVSEVNTMAQMGKLKILGLKPFDRFFEENPASQILIRGIRGEQARTAADFYEAVTQFGRYHNIAEPLPEGFEYVKNAQANPLADVKSKTIMQGGKPVTINERLIFDSRIAKQVDLVHQSLVLPPGTHPILNIFDRMQDEWKAWTLAIFPAYHTRNVVGNIWNNYLAGIHTPEPYLKALSIQRNLPIQITLGNGQIKTGQEVLALAKRHDILNIGQYWGDIEKYFEADLKEGIGKYYGKTLRKPVNWGLKAGNYFQNNANLALFVRRLEEGFSPADAAMEVKKFQFDYRNLTQFESDIVKRVFPFFTWTRFNIPLQLEALATHPARLMVVAKGRNALESNYDGTPDERLLPDYFSQNFPIRIRFDKAKNQYEYFLLNNWLPAADIDKIFDPPSWVRNQLTPLLKEPAQQLANRDFFTGKEIDETGGSMLTSDKYETIKIVGNAIKLEMPARRAHVLKNIRFISELDRLQSSDLSALGKGFRLVTGKLYPFNEEQSRVSKNIELRDRKKNLVKMLRKARKEENTSEENRILKKLDSLSSSED